MPIRLMAGRLLWSVVLLLWCPCYSQTPPQAPCPARAACSGPKNVKDYVATVIKSPTYGSRVPRCNVPVHVETQFGIRFLEDVDQKSGLITVGGYWRTWWKDTRLAFNDTDNGGCFDSITLDHVDIHKTIWWPNLYVDNGVKIDSGNSVIQIQPDGAVWYSFYAKITSKCEFHFGKLPFDSHRFRMRLGSYSLGMDTVSVTARNGAAGAVDGESSGVGISGPHVSSPVWEVEGTTSTETRETKTETPGVITIVNGWQFVDIGFDFARMPKFLIEQVLLQDFVFLFITYLGFYVNPAAVPARATLAIIPMLIMRLLSNSLYKDMPQIGYRVWIADYLGVSMGICALACFELAVVSYFLVLEARRQAKYVSFKKCEASVEHLVDESINTKTPLRTILSEHQPFELGDHRITWFQRRDNDRAIQRASNSRWDCQVTVDPDVEIFSEQTETSPRNSIIVKEVDGLDIDLDDEIMVRNATEKQTVQGPKDAGRITEEKTAILQYVLHLFTATDRDGTDSVSVSEVQTLLSNFNIFMLQVDVAETISRSMRDRGTPTPLDEMKVCMNFSQFALYIFDVVDLKATLPDRFQHPFSKAFPKSVRCEIFFKWFFPLLVVMKTAIFFMFLPMY